MRRRAAAWALAAGLGALHGQAFSPPLDAWWLQTALLAATLALARAARATVPPASVAGAFGLGWFVAGVYWLHVSMHVYGGMPWSLAALALVLFAAYLSLYPALAVAAAGLASRAGAPDDGTARPALARACAIAGCWGASEILRGWVFTGFPWLAIGYAHVDGPLAGYAPWLGVYGIGALAALVAALVAEAAAPRGAGDAPRPAARAALAGVALAVLALGAALRPLEPTAVAGEPVRVRLVQGDVPQQLKFDPARAIESMAAYAGLVEQGSAQLTVLPETAWVVPWRSTPPEIAQRLLGAAQSTGATIALGMPLPEAGPAPAGGVRRYTNSVALIGAASASLPVDAQVLARYDKRHLVPFGEFVPWGFAWFVRLMNIPLGEFGRGAPQQPAFEVAGQRFAFNVCYEDLFGEELLGSLAGERGASVLVNVSNIAWFGDTRALPQHLAIARMRTLETGRPMLRSTNTGVTAAIDHRGRVLASLPPYRRGAIDVEVRGTAGLTFYARHGNPVAWALALALALAGAAALARRPRGNGGNG